MMDITITSWFTLTNFTSTDTSILTDIIRKTLLPLTVLHGQMLLALAILLEQA